MNFLNFEQLPFVGMSYQFHGEQQGAPFSVYIVNAKPGQGPPLHTHPYVEVEFTLEGTGTMTFGDETHESGAEAATAERLLARRFSAGEDTHTLRRLLGRCPAVSRDDAAIAGARRGWVLAPTRAVCSATLCGTPANSSGCAGAVAACVNAALSFLLTFPAR